MPSSVSRMFVRWSSQHWNIRSIRELLFYHVVSCFIAIGISHHWNITIGFSLKLCELFAVVSHVFLVHLMDWMEALTTFSMAGLSWAAGRQVLLFVMTSIVAFCSDLLVPSWGIQGNPMTSTSHSTRYWEAEKVRKKVELVKIELWLVGGWRNHGIWWLPTYS